MSIRGQSHIREHLAGWGQVEPELGFTGFHRGLEVFLIG
jgi:hypothetical protein